MDSGLRRPSFRVDANCPRRVVVVQTIRDASKVTVNALDRNLCRQSSSTPSIDPQALVSPTVVEIAALVARSIRAPPLAPRRRLEFEIIQRAGPGIAHVVNYRLTPRVVMDMLQLLPPPKPWVIEISHYHSPGPALGLLQCEPFL